MAYEVTATRRRPKTFDEMAGQEFVVATLKSSIETGRIAHAYLFSGPRGCGKTSAARILARSLNCEKGPTATPCGTCSACQEIARGASLDVIEIDGASNTSVNDVRQIKDEVLFPPNSGRYKIYIIDEVHMLSNSAFNALLKTIEEPPPYIVFIFATTELHKVPATIKSRCQQFNFRLFSIETIKNLLAQACREVNIEAEDEALFWIAKEATGSMRDAYTLLDQVVAFSDGQLRSALIREKLGIVGLDAVNALAEACAEGKPAEALEMVDAILDRGISVERFVVDLAGYYRSLLLLKSGIEKESVLAYAPDRFSAVALNALSLHQVERAVALLLDLYRNIRFSVSPRFELETAVSRLCWLSRWISADELRAAIDGVRGRLLGGETAARWGPPAAEREAPAAEPAPIPDPDRGAVAAPTPIRETESPPPSAGATIDLDRPGAFTETFKRFLADRSAKESAAPMQSVPPAQPTPMQTPTPAQPAASAPQATAEAAAAQASAQSAYAPAQPAAVVEPRAEPIPVRPPAFEPSPDSYEPYEDDEEPPSFEEVRTATAAPPTPPPQPAPAAEADGSGSLEVVKRGVIDALRRERGLLASGLEKSLPWEAEGERVIIPATDRLAAELLGKDAHAIQAALLEITGKPFIVEVVERSSAGPAAASGARTETIPQIETVRRMFRGTIVRNAPTREQRSV